MRNPYVSVLLAEYNSEQYIRECIDSVLNQTYTDFELIIIDDASTDGSWDIISGIEDARIKTIRLEHNRHVAQATNIGMEYVTGEYVAIIDSDDIWYPDKLEKQITFLEKNKQYDACFSWVDIIGESGAVINDERPELVRMFSAENRTGEEWLRYFFFKGNCLNNPSSVVRVEAMREVGIHNSFYTVAQDFDWWIRFAKRFKFYILPERLIKYRRLNEMHKNVSGFSEENNTCFYNEMITIRYNYFDNIDDDLFINTFKEYFRNKQAVTPVELKCEKAFLLLLAHDKPELFSIPSSVPGLMKMQELLRDMEASDYLFNQFGFATSSLREYKVEHLFFDNVIEFKLHVYRDMVEQKDRSIDYYQKAQEEQIQYIKSLEKQLERIGELEHTIEEITNSTSWKVTEPLRKIKNQLRKNDD